MGALPLVARAESYGDAIAIDASDGRWTYDQLLIASARIAATLLAGRNDLEEARVAFLAEPGGRQAALLLGIWRAGGIAVPLALSHPPPELAHVLDDAGVSTLIVDPEHLARVQSLAHEREIRIIQTPSTARILESDDATVSDGEPVMQLPAVDESRRALMVYTSGTTGRPKGAVHTHRSLRAQIESLVDAWAWSPRDHTILVLPLHHVHGLVNVQLCALWCGAHCTVLTPFDPERTWARIAAGDLTLFMAVPTIYSRLIAAWEAASPEARNAMTAGCRSMRLMVSGSAALPVRTLERWHEISGHTLLERYGMTEIGMALSNPLVGERRPGHVGAPLPGVQVRLARDDASPADAAEPGEIEVRGAAVFLEYWRRPDETRAAFRHGWFRTGDIAVLDDDSFRILGRNNVDILKTGGYKVSALEIEDVLREHPAVADCAVVGVPDNEWGERVAAAIVPNAGESIDTETLSAWAAERLAPYKVPRLVRLLDALPRNAMGKVTKPAVRTLFQHPS